MDHLDAQAAQAKITRTAFVKWQLLGGDVRPMNDAELDGLLAAKAREGNMRAIELLWRRVPVAPVTSSEPEAPTTDVLAEVFAFRGRGAKP
jgi:hypothetical protein